jgi:hypothetical protein
MKWVKNKQNVAMRGQVNNQTSTLRPAHEQRHAHMILKCLLEAKQILICVGDPPKKLATRNKTKLLGSQKMGPKNKQLETIELGYLLVSFGSR